MKKRYLSLALLTLFVLSANAENVRLNVTRIYTITPEQEAVSLDIALEEALALIYRQPTPLIQGLEIKLTLPDAIRSYSNTTGLFLYNRGIPDAEEGIRNYRVSRYGFEVLTDTRFFYLYLPLSERGAHTVPPGTVRYEKPLTAEGSPLFLTFLPMMKGFPTSLYDEPITVSLTPVPADQGKLHLSVEGAPPEAVTVNLDGTPRPFKSDGYLLPPGQHTLRVSAQGAMEKTLEVDIERGRRTEAAVVLQQAAPRLILEAPEGSEVYLDGSLWDYAAGFEQEIEAGEHVILYRLGDYKLSRKFTAEAGEIYKISLLLDIFIENN